MLSIVVLVVSVILVGFVMTGKSWCSCSSSYSSAVMSIFRSPAKFISFHSLLCFISMILLIKIFLFPLGGLYTTK